MTSPKALKALARARMAATGETYTQARKQILRGARPGDWPANAESAYPGDTENDTENDTADGEDSGAPGSAARGTASPGRAGAGGSARQGVEGGTGRTREEWHALLDEWGGTTRTHTQLARWLVREHELKGYWAQAVAVGYEQARGMRAASPAGEGSAPVVAVSLERTIDVPIADAFHAFVDEWIRSDWLPEVSFRVRDATAPVTVRADWRDGHGTGGRLAVDLTELGPEQTRVTLVHDGLAGTQESARMKTYWTEHLTLLKEQLEDERDE